MTTCQSVIDAFFHYIEEDVDFFDYFELDETECIEVAEERANVLLTEAISYISRKLMVENVFSNTREIVENELTIKVFDDTLTDTEINLLVKAMFLCYLQRDITKLRTFHGVMTSTDLNMYSPANERKTFIAMVQQYEDNLKVEISEYQMVDRTTGTYVQICE